MYGRQPTRHAWIPMRGVSTALESLAAGLIDVICLWGSKQMDIGDSFPPSPCRSLCATLSKTSLEEGRCSGAGCVEATTKANRRVVGTGQEHATWLKWRGFIPELSGWRFRKDGRVL